MAITRYGTRGWRRFRAGLILLAVAVLIPAGVLLWFYAGSGDPDPLQVALPLDRETAAFDIQVSQRGWYLLSLRGNAIAHDEYDGLTYDHGLDCMLALPQIDQWPEKCAGQPAPLRFHFRLTGPAGLVQQGEFHDPDRYWSVFVDQQSHFAGAEFASLDNLPRGHYRLELSGIRAPAGLSARQPQLHLQLQSDPYDFMPALISLALMALSAVLAVVAVVLLIRAGLRKRAPDSVQPAGEAR